MTLRGLITGLAVAGATVAASIAPASASDHNWGGIYIGASAGWVGTDIDWRYPNGTGPTGIDHSNGLLGGHVGLQHQMGRFVVGIEGTWAGTHAFDDGDYDGGLCSGNVNFRCVGRLHSIWTLGARAGVTLGDHWLLYATGGFAQGRISTQTRSVATGNTFDMTSSNNDGYFIGAGIEYALTKNVLLGVEYVHVDLADRNVPANNNLASEVRTNLNADVDVVRARLTFKLGRPEEKHEDSLK